MKPEPPARAAFVKVVCSNVFNKYDRSYRVHEALKLKIAYKIFLVDFLLKKKLSWAEESLWVLVGEAVAEQYESLPVHPVDIYFGLA